VPDFLADKLARLAFLVVKWWFLHNSDRAMAVQVKLAQRLIYAMTGDEFMNRAVGEVSDIFKTGGRPAQMVRKILAAADDDFTVAMVKTVLRED
jgi:hypothetical protein